MIGVHEECLGLGGLKQRVDEWRGGSATNHDEQAENQQGDDERYQPEFFVLFQHGPDISQEAGLPVLPGLFKGVFGIVTHSRKELGLRLSWRQTESKGMR